MTVFAGYGNGNDRACRYVGFTADGGSGIPADFRNVDADDRCGNIDAAVVAGSAFVAGRVFDGGFGSVTAFGQCLRHFDAVTAVRTYAGADRLYAASAVGHGDADNGTGRSIGGAADKRGVVGGVVRGVYGNDRCRGVDHVSFAVIVITGFGSVSCFVADNRLNAVAAIRQCIRYFRLITAVGLYRGSHHLAAAAAVGYGQGNGLSFFHIGSGTGEGRRVVVAQIRRFNGNGCRRIYRTVVAGFTFVTGRVFDGGFGSVAAFGQCLRHFDAVTAVRTYAGADRLYAASAVGHGDADNGTGRSIGGAADKRGVVGGVVRGVYGNDRCRGVDHVSFAVIVITGFGSVSCFVADNRLNAVAAIRQCIRYFRLITAVGLYRGSHHLAAAAAVGYGQGNGLSFFHIGSGTGEGRRVVVAQIRRFNGNNGCCINFTRIRSRCSFTCRIGYCCRYSVFAIG